MEQMCPKSLRVDGKLFVGDVRNDCLFCVNCVLLDLCHFITEFDDFYSLLTDVKGGVSPPVCFIKKVKQVERDTIHTKTEWNLNVREEMGDD